MRLELTIDDVAEMCRRAIPSGAELYMDSVNTMNEAEFQRHLEELKKLSRAIFELILDALGTEEGSAA